MDLVNVPTAPVNSLNPPQYPPRKIVEPEFDDDYHFAGTTFQFSETAHPVDPGSFLCLPCSPQEAFVSLKERQTRIARLKSELETARTGIEEARLKLCQRPILLVMTQKQLGFVHECLTQFEGILVVSLSVCESAVKSYQRLHPNVKVHSNVSIRGNNLDDSELNYEGWFDGKDVIFEKVYVEKLEGGPLSYGPSYMGYDGWT